MSEKPKPKYIQDEIDAMFRTIPWVRYRFSTRSVRDYRPIVFNPSYPWWCSGEAGDGKSVTIIAWLPNTERIRKFWPDAKHIEAKNYNKIEYTDRFPKPEWYEENGKDRRSGGIT